MAKYLRDEQLSNLRIDIDALIQIADSLAWREVSMLEYLNPEHENAPETFLTFLIRFDEKGYRVFEKHQLLEYFQSATRVERVIFELISGAALRSNRQAGSYLDLRLDVDERAPCFLTVSSDDEDWMNATFTVVKDILQTRQSRNYLIRNSWVELIIQLFGVAAGFFVSLWGASLIAPELKLENAFLVSFVLVLLVFSNLWVPIRLKALALLVRSFPTIRFYRHNRDRMHWLYEAIVGGVVVAGTLYVLHWSFLSAGKLLGKFLGHQ